MYHKTVYVYPQYTHAYIGNQPYESDRTCLPTIRKKEEKEKIFC